MMIRIVFRLCAAVLAAVLLAAVAIMAAGFSGNVRPADVGVVFGNRVERWGVPSASLAARLDRAASLYQQGLYPYVIVSGGLGREGWDEALVMADYLVERGVPRQAILTDRQGNNTYLTALHTAQLAEEHGFQSFVLVSHFYHLPRARLAFDRFGLRPVYTAYAERFVARDFYYGLMREVIALPAYFLRTYSLEE
jgi:uncharacterized SAM-binding protein YcdF (DUF218 family)